MPAVSTVALFYESELELMAACMAEHPNLETGGDLFGLWTHDGAPVVMLATGPGPQARHYPTSFYQDASFLESTHRDIHNRHGLVNLGGWHSHHHIGLDQPSGGDLQTVWSGLAETRWPRFLLAIGNFPERGERSCSFGLSVFHTGHHRVEQVGARVLPGASPYRRWLPRWRVPAWSIRTPQLPWAARPENAALIRSELRGVRALEAHGIHADARDSEGQLVITLRGARSGRVVLGDGYPSEAPQCEGWPERPWRFGHSVADWLFAALAEEAVASEALAAEAMAEDHRPALAVVEPQPSESLTAMPECVADRDVAGVDEASLELSSVELSSVHLDSVEPDSVEPDSEELPSVEPESVEPVAVEPAIAEPVAVLDAAASSVIEPAVDSTVVDSVVVDSAVESEVEAAIEPVAETIVGPGAEDALLSRPIDAEPDVSAFRAYRIAHFHRRRSPASQDATSSATSFRPLVFRSLS